MSKNANISIKDNTYDEVPYHSYPYAQSQPENLYTIGRLFGMTPPDVRKARVLELGCAEGGNLMPHALRYPDATFVGVDLSRVQVEAGQNHIKALNLKNIELKHCSIMDVDSSFGEFDYIICHGVISWVPEEVREKIFEISSKNLSKNGIAYISYNTLPGWNMVRTIRDMMLYHSQNFTSPQDKITQSRLLLQFMNESLQDQKTPYAEMLRSETQLLQNQSDHYLRHDHLEEDNKQYYFHEFIERAQSYKLQYLSDCSLASMYLGNMPKNVIEKLQVINDIVRTEQYMDYIVNRRFRSTLLCHSDVKLNRALTNEDAKKFSMTLNVTPEKKIDEVNLTDNAEQLKFFFNNSKDNSIGAASAGLKAILYTFAENLSNPLKFDDLVKKASSKLKSANAKEEIEKDLINNAMNLVIKGYIQIASESGNKDTVNLNKPKVSELIIYQASKTSNNWVTNQLHVPVAINVFDKFAIPYMDGKRNKKQILELLLNDAKSGKITLNKDNRKLEEDAEISKELETFYDNMIERFSSQAMFI